MLQREVGLIILATGQVFDECLYCFRCGDTAYVGEALNDRALGLAESLLCISAGGVGDVDWGADLDVIAEEGDVSQEFADSPI